VRQLLAVKSEANLREAKVLLRKAAEGGDSESAKALEVLRERYPQLFKDDSPYPILLGWQTGVPQGATGKRSAGSAVAVTPLGHLITNKHVVEGCSRIVAFYNGQWAEAAVIAQYDEPDLALLLAGASTPYFVNVDASPPRLGEKVLVGGWPAWAPKTTADPKRPPASTIVVSDGIVSAKDGGWAFAMTAPISSGNSGGPVLGEGGALRGISWAGGLSGITESGNALSDRYFAVSAESIVEILKGKGLRIRTADDRKRKLDATDLARITAHTAALITCD
jgi:S1-C subfamily serine protease